MTTDRDGHTTDDQSAGASIVHIHGLGHYHPPNIIDNSFLESLDIGTSDTWIMARVGIRRRHTALPLDYIRETKNADPREAERAATCDGVRMAVSACTMALSRAGIPASAIGLVICGGSAPAYGSPAVASLIAAELGISAPCFDINAACTTFAVHAYAMAAAQTTCGPDFVLSVLPENLTKTVDYRDRNTAVLMGDAATACVFSRRVPGRIVLTNVVIGCDPSRWRKVQIGAAGFLTQDGAAVQSFAVRKTSAMLKMLKAPDDIFVGHQANLRMLDAVCAQQSVPQPRHLHNVDTRGNCGAAGAPSVLSEHWDSLLQARATATVAVVGAGLSWGAFRLRFDPP